MNEEIHTWVQTNKEVCALLRQAHDALALSSLPGGLKRRWVGLTPQQRDEINEQVYGAVPHHVAFHAAIEAKLKELNT